MKDSLNLIIEKEKERYIIMMVVDMKAIGEMTKEKEREHFIIIMVTMK